MSTLALKRMSGFAATRCIGLILTAGVAGATLTIENEAIAQGPRFRVDLRHGLEDADLIVWIEREATEPFEMTLMRR